MQITDPLSNTHKTRINQCEYHFQQHIQYRTFMFEDEVTQKCDLTCTRKQHEKERRNCGTHNRTEQKKLMAKGNKHKINFETY